MKEKQMNKIEQIDFILNKLEHLKGLEFVSTKEIKACNYAKLILNRHKQKLEKMDKLKED